MPSSQYQAVTGSSFVWENRAHRFQPVATVIKIHRAASYYWATAVLAGSTSMAQHESPGVVQFNKGHINLADDTNVATLPVNEL